MMIEGSVGRFLGYVHVHQKGYWDEQTLDRSMMLSDSLNSTLASVPEVRSVVPRLQTYALAAGQEHSRPAMILGIDLWAEEALIDPKNRMVSGEYFEANDERSVLIGEDMPERLGVQIGDSLVLIGQGFRGVSAAGLYRIKGTLTFPDQELNRSLVMLPIETASVLFGTEDRRTSLILIPEDPGEINGITEELSSKLSREAYEIMTWRELVPELIQGIEADRGSGLIIILILYMIVGFGILGTVLMMIAERNYELGVMVAVGTPRKIIALVLAAEILMLSIMGSLGGILLSIPVAWYFNVDPIELTGNMAEVMETYGMDPYLPFATEPSIFLHQALVILFITVVFSLVPVLRAMLLDPITAMRA